MPIKRQSSLGVVVDASVSIVFILFNIGLMRLQVNQNLRYLISDVKKCLHLPLL